ncbi:hypothetical protein Gpo141_00009741 [Globisporangium polare]
MFPTEVRAKGVALAAVRSTALLAGIKEFYLEAVVLPYVTIACGVFAFAFVIVCCPETKRLSLEDSHAQFERGCALLR